MFNLTIATSQRHLITRGYCSSSAQNYGYSIYDIYETERLIESAFIIIMSLVINALQSPSIGLIITKLCKFAKAKPLLTP